MNTLLSALLLACLAHSTVAFLLAPTILNPHSSSNHTICQDDQLEGAFDGEPAQLVGPYLVCLHESRLQIKRATLKQSDRANCPLQFVDNKKGGVCDVGFEPKPIDVTEDVKARCEGKEACFFSFDTIFPSLSCLSSTVKAPKRGNREHGGKSERGNNERGNSERGNSERGNNGRTVTKPGKVIAREFQQVTVTYACELIRPRFRPFSNKLHDAKYTRNIAHPYRKLSYNHLQAL